MYCFNCGKELAEDTVFCMHCGTKQDNDSSQTSANDSQQSAPNNQQTTQNIGQQFNPNYGYAGYQQTAYSYANPYAGQGNPQYVPMINSAEIANKVRSMEKTSHILWLILGIIQCCLVFAAIAGIWNIINSVIALNNLKNITPGNPSVVTYFQSRKTWIIIAGVINVLIGGVIGIGLTIFDWYIVSYVENNRAAFETPQYAVGYRL